MTVIKTDRAPTVTVEEVVARIKDNVWILICAGQMDAALVLLRAQLEDFERAWLPTYVAKAPLALPGPEVVAPTAVFAAAEMAPTASIIAGVPEPTTAGTLVHVVTATGATVGVSRLPRAKARSKGRKAITS